MQANHASDIEQARAGGRNNGSHNREEVQPLRDGEELETLQGENGPGDIRRIQVMQDLGYNIKAVNRAGKGLDRPPTKSSLPRVDQRPAGTRPAHKKEKADGRSAGAKVVQITKNGRPPGPHQPVREIREIIDPDSGEDRPLVINVGLGLDAGSSTFQYNTSPVSAASAFQGIKSPVSTVFSSDIPDIHPAFRTTSFGQPPHREVSIMGSRPQEPNQI